VGHLAIFVGTKVAAREHSQFINYMDLIDGLPPGLYEIVITDKRGSDVGAELLVGNYNVRIEMRDISDIQALGHNSLEDERAFETVRRVSELNNALYASFVQPWLKAAITPQVAAATLAMQPLRLGYALFADQNPMMRWVAPLAERARAERKPVAAENPFLKAQRQFSDRMTQWLEALGELRDQTEETVFHAIYGAPWLQAWMGVSRLDGPPRPKPGTSPEHEAALAAKIEELRSTMTEGGPLEAAVRSLVYVAMGQGVVDARSFETLRRILEDYPEITLQHYKSVVRTQWAMLTIDQKSALSALPSLLPEDAEARRNLFEKVKAIRTAAGALEGEAKRRLDEIEAMFNLAALPPSVRGTSRKPKESAATEKA
jgi:hypothetical protein